MPILQYRTSQTVYYEPSFTDTLVVHIARLHLKPTGFYYAQLTTWLWQKESHRERMLMRHKSDIRRALFLIWAMGICPLCRTV